MLKIQIGHSNFLRYDPKQCERRKPYPPLATIQIAVLLRQMGHAVVLFDAMLADGVEGFEEAVQAAAPDLVSSTRTTSTTSPRCASAACAKRPAG